MAHGSSTQLTIQGQKDPTNLRKIQFKVCSSEEITVLIKIFTILYFILIVGLTILNTSTDLRLWHSKSEGQKASSGYDFPANLKHNMSDDELFRHALDVNKLYMNHSMMSKKIAFMFLTKGPLPHAALWEKYFEGYEGLYSIYIHENPPYIGHYPNNSVFHQRQIPSKLVKWGSLSMVDAERRLLANALLDISNEWFMILSESCIPVYNFSSAYNYFKGSLHSFVDSFVDSEYGVRLRYNANLAPEINATQWRKGSQWIEFNRKHAIALLGDNIYYPKFNQNREEVRLPEEHYIQTILTIKTPHLLANRSVTWADWSRGGSHPATYGRQDINEMLLKSIREEQTCSYNGRPTRLCFLFARKFAPSALQPLLQLAPAVLGVG